jgi:hypothetical protein
MSFAPPPSGNPFQSPQGSFPEGKQVTYPEGNLASTHSGGLEYMRAYNYIFENPKWMTNILWGFVCLISTALIPIVGQLVFVGYQFEVLEALCLSRGTRYPDFSTDRFGDYLGRGIWPFLVGLVGGLVIAPIALVLYIIGILVVTGGMAAGGKDVGPIIALILVPLVILVFVTVIFLMSCLLLPMMIRAGLTQDFGQGFNMGWALAFLKKMWLEVLLSGLFLGMTGMLLYTLGLMALCVGAFAAMAVVMLAQTHFYYQLYAIFLARGGEPIPLKPRMPPPMMPPPMPLPQQY